MKNKPLLPFILLFAVSFHSQGQNIPCDASLWQHVYHKYRLKVIEECKSVTGVVVSLRKEKDGDYHIRLRLDPGQGDLLNEKNIEKQQGCLVIEIICANEVTQQDAIGACSDYVNNVSIPARGQHIKVTGSYVYDSQHGWNEIHPVTGVVVLN